jgi:hypothetical protein
MLEKIIINYFKKKKKTTATNMEICIKINYDIYEVFTYYDNK